MKNAEEGRVDKGEADANKSGRQELIENLINQYL